VPREKLPENLKKRSLSITLPYNVWEMLERVHNETKVPRSVIISRALEAWLKGDE